MRNWEADPSSAKVSTQNLRELQGVRGRVRPHRPQGCVLSLRTASKCIVRHALRIQRCTASGGRGECSNWQTGKAPSIQQQARHRSTSTTCCWRSGAPNWRGMSTSPKSSTCWQHLGSKSQHTRVKEESESNGSGQPWNPLRTTSSLAPPKRSWTRSTSPSQTGRTKA